MGAHAAPEKKSNGDDKTASIKKWSSKLGIAFLAVAVIAAIFSFLPIGKGEKKVSGRTVATASEKVYEQRTITTTTTPIAAVPPPSPEWGEPMVAPVGKDARSEPVRIPAKHQIFRLADGEYVVLCRDLFLGWLEQDTCPNGADQEAYRSAGQTPVNIRVRFEPANG